MKKSPDEDAGTIQVMLERLEKFRLPRALAIKARVDQGEPLREDDVQFLKRVFEDAQSAQTLGTRHPEYQAMIVKVVGLYDEITRKALENEQRK